MRPDQHIFFSSVALDPLLLIQTRVSPSFVDHIQEITDQHRIANIHLGTGVITVVAYCIVVALGGMLIALVSLLDIIDADGGRVAVGVLAAGDLAGLGLVVLTIVGSGGRTAHIGAGQSAHNDRSLGTVHGAATGEGAFVIDAAQKTGRVADGHGILIVGGDRTPVGDCGLGGLGLGHRGSGHLQGVQIDDVVHDLGHVIAVDGSVHDIRIELRLPLRVGLGANQKSRVVGDPHIGASPGFVARHTVAGHALADQ